MKLGGQFRTSVRSIWAVGVSPKALSGGGSGGGGSPPWFVNAPTYVESVERIALLMNSTTLKSHFSVATESSFHAPESAFFAGRREFFLGT